MPEPRLVGIEEVPREAFLDYARATREGGDARYAKAESDYEGWLARWRESARGENPSGGGVPAALFCLVDGERVLGATRLRLRMTPELLEEGGHCGYEIRPSERGRGFGTLVLRLALLELEALGIERVRITCDDDNGLSARVIERNGGVLDDKGISAESGKLVRRYWIGRSSAGG